MGSRLGMALLTCACTTEGVLHDEILPPHAIVEGFRQVVPGPGLPPEVELQPANNNLSVTRHEGRVFLAWRTAPSHFASTRARVWVISSDDEHTWRFEGGFHLGRDLREPHLVSTEHGLWLYLAVLGESPIDFQPGGVVRALWRGPDDWTDLEVFGPEGLVAWRIVPLVDGRWHLFGYLGGESVYDLDADPIRAVWLASDDGVTWEPAVGDDPVVLEGGGSEVSGVLLDDGSLVAVVRNERGDEDGFGSKICTAPAGDLGTWTCTADPRKHDSPLVVRSGGRVWLVARRQVGNDGAFDLGRDDLPYREQYLTYQSEYWQTPKRCALWAVDPEARTVAHVADLPSAGDTCFPDAIPDGDDRWILYNYSNDPEDEDLSWISGQTRPTHLFRMDLTLR